MTISRSQLVKWVAGQIGPLYYDRATNRDWLFIEAAVEKPWLLRHLAHRAADRLVWRVGWQVGWFRFEPTNERRQARVLRIVRGAPAFLAYFEPRLQDPDDDGVSMFWDLVLDAREDAPEPLRAAVFEALKEQLAYPAPGLQDSALHGFGHLKDPRSQPLIQAFIDRCPPGDLRDYAEMALRYEVL